MTGPLTACALGEAELETDEDGEAVASAVGELAGLAADVLTAAGEARLLVVAAVVEAAAGEATAAVVDELLEPPHAESTSAPTRAKAAASAKTGLISYPPEV